MIDKYEDKFKEMYNKVIQGQNPLKVIGEYVPFFEKEGIGHLGLVSCFNEYIEKRIR